MNNLRKFAVGDLVAIIGMCRQPTFFDYHYLDQLNTKEISMLYKIISIDYENETCFIKPTKKAVSLRSDFPLEYLILIKQDKPKLRASALVVP